MARTRSAADRYAPLLGLIRRLRLLSVIFVLFGLVVVLVNAAEGVAIIVVGTVITCGAQIGLRVVSQAVSE